MLYCILSVLNLNLMESNTMLEQHIDAALEEAQIEFDQEASELTFEDYQVEAMVYRKPSSDPIYALLNLASETGELLGKVAKHIRDAPEGAKNDPDYVEAYMEGMVKELGDILWMCAALADDLEVSLGQVAL